MKPEAGQLIGGKYLLARPLAQGGMGELWVGHHVELDIAVAVKFLEPKLAAEVEFVRRFQREARAAARLRSAHVARIHDYGMERGAPYIAMELLEGETLAECLTREGRLPLARIAAVVAQLAKGLAEAHAAGIVHRDLKPSNVFLARVAGEEVVKILDFGIAKELYGRAHDTAVTDSGVLLGSPRYMSPEQARGAAIDHRTDLWSLGVLVFEAVTGRPLFDTHHQGNLIAAITGDPLPRVIELCPDLPPALEGFFERALARNPDARFRRVGGLAAALSAIAEGREPVREESLDTQEMQPFRASLQAGPARPSAPPSDGSTRRGGVVPPAGRSSPTLAVSPEPPGDGARARDSSAGLASTIRRRQVRVRRWYAIGAAVVLLGGLGLWVASSPRAGAPFAPSAVYRGALASALRAGAARPPAAAPVAAPPAASGAPSATARPRAAPRVAQPAAQPAKPAASSPKPAPTVDPNFGLPVSKP
jgi:serine/threonine-protein kinase